MRLSTLPSDPAYNIDEALNCKVYFNGEQHNDVVTADEELGELIVHKRNELGMIEITNDDNIATETLYGEVKIVLRNKE